MMSVGKTVAVLRAAVLAAVLAASGYAARATEGMTTFADPDRIVAIGGSVTEIVYALGEEKRLIARDMTSVYPEAAFSLPSVGYMRALSPEGVMSVKPSAILALAGSGPKEAIDVLKKAAVPYIEVPDTFDHDGIVRKIEVVGKAIGTEEKAAKLAAKVDAELDAAEALTANIESRKRVLFILTLQDGKILGSGGNTAADGIIRFAGGVNAIEGFSGYRPLSDEAIITARPDMILMMDRGDGSSHAAVEQQLFALPAIQSTPAGEQRKFLRMNGAYLLGFGPRTANAVRDLATALYGDAIKQQ
jgi:iron complex transport system substrate-binding protein